MTTDTISVNLGDRSYDIVVGTNLLSEAGNHIAPLINCSPVIVVTDETVGPLHLAILLRSLDRKSVV